MKKELANEVIIRMIPHLNETQSQLLKDTLSLVLHEYEVSKAETSLSTQVCDNGYFLKKYLQQLIVSGRSEGTIEQYRLHISILLQDINKNVLDINEDDITYHLAYLKRAKNLSNTYLNNKRVIYNAFFTWLRKKHYISENPVDNIDLIKSDTKIKSPLSDEEREMVRCNCRTERDLALVDFMYSTAARVSEICRLNISDIDFRQKCCIVKGKGRKERIVYINDTALYHLKNYLESRTDNNPALFVSARRPNNRLSKDSMGAILRRLGKTASVKNVHPHRYRRTSITNAINRGMPIQDVQCMAGHSKPTTTMIYCTIDTEKVRMGHKMFLSS